MDRHSTIPPVERTIAIFRSFAEADEAEAEYYASLSPRERVDLLLDMIQRYTESSGEAANRLERVYRIVKLSQS
jgi:hypothetical protein